MSEKQPKPALLGGNVSRNENGDFRGAEGHIGLDHTQDGTHLQVANVGGGFGAGGDRELFGAHVNATLAGVQHDPADASEGGSGFWGGMRTLDAGAGAYHDSDSGSGEVGFRADIINAEAGYRQIDHTSQEDRGLRVGLAQGLPSGGARWYNQDVDGDEAREYGFGVSAPVGPVGVSLDYTTETPFADAADMARIAMNPTWAINPGMERLGLGEYSPDNMAKRGAEALWEWARGGSEK